METMLLLVVLMMNADSGSRESLKNFLRFYRENRELIAALSGQNPQDIVEKSEEAPTKNRPQKESVEKKAEPQEEVGDPKILEEYLKRFCG